MINDIGPSRACGLTDAASMEFGFHPETVNIAIQYFHFLISQAETEPNSSIIVVAHSEGAMIAKLAANKLEASDQKKIQIWTPGRTKFCAEWSMSPKHL